MSRIEQAWPTILQRLEAVDRGSWLVAAAATVQAFRDDVLTLGFASASDVAKFKKLQAGRGPSEDLRQAIQAELGVRVKYIARHSGHGGPGEQGGGSGGSGDSGGGPGDQGGGPDRPGGSSGPVPPHTQAAGVPATPPPAQRSAPARAQAAPEAAAPVTDWAVAPIPSDPSGAATAVTPGQLAVDDEPEDAASVLIATLAPAREGDVLPAREIETSLPPDDDEREADEEMTAPEAPVQVVAPRLSTVRDDGVERVGEAVVRQVLRATFLREEPFETATRFH
jgi:DNA polymerase-3 subunit gamma/tau